MMLYTHSISSSSRRVNLMVAHLGIQLDQTLIDLRRPEDRAKLVAVNPNAKIPVLVTPELTLWESHAIAQYLCDRDPRGAELYPTDIVSRADVNRWLFWVSAHLAPNVGHILFERLWRRFAQPGTAPDAAVIAKHEGMLQQAAKVLDAHLADRQWVVGKSLTLADYSIASTLMYRAAGQLPLEAFANVAAYLARVEATPAWAATEPAKLG